MKRLNNKMQYISELKDLELMKQEKRTKKIEEDLELKIFELNKEKEKTKEAMEESITDDLIERCRVSGYDGMCLTVDTLVAGNREKDHRTGFTTPPKLTLKSLMSFATRPEWVFNYFTHKKFELANDELFTQTKNIKLPNGDQSLVTFIKLIDDYIVFGNNSAVSFIPLDQWYDDPKSCPVYQLYYGEDIEGEGSEQNMIFQD